MHTTADARGLSQAHEFLIRNQIRLAQDTLIIVTADPSGRTVLQDAASSIDARVIVLTAGALEACRPIGRRALIDVARPQLLARDLYDLKSSVTRSADFFGRAKQLEDIENAILLGNSHQGLFGLRKVGKTSFMVRLRENIRNRGNRLLAQVDLQRSNAINPTAEYLLWHLGETLVDNNRRVRGVKGLKLFGHFSTFSEVSSPSSIFELFDHDLSLIFTQVRRPVIFMMDEIERIFPKDVGSTWQTDFVRLWQLLRGIDQEQPGNLRFVISGTNPDCVESHSVFGSDNPIYSYFSVSYLKPFSEQEAGSLLNTYGRLMGIDWSAFVVRRVFEDTGGHPALLRTYASLMHQRYSERSDRVTPNVEDGRDVATEFLSQQGPLLAQVIAILEDQYRDEFEIIKVLAEGRVHEFRDMARAFPQDTAHLVGYGLCGDPEQATRLTSQLLHTYLQRRGQGPQRQVDNKPLELVGETIDNQYQIEALLSSGGYSHVYRAKGIDHGRQQADVALKVLPYGRLHQLEREVEVLQGYDHSGIVGMRGSGRLPDTRVYLAMEFVDGLSMRHYCQAATRPSESRLLFLGVGTARRPHDPSSQRSCHQTVKGRAK